ncbi:MAG: hypothetical protein ACQETO_10755, partial [Pseudomonadota bacterium]
MYRQFFSLIFAVMTGLSLNASAQELSVRGGFSGYWFNADNEQQAVQIEVIDPRSAAVSWLTYDSTGEPVWLAGFGNVRGDTIEATLSRFSGGRFPTASETGQASLDILGLAEIEFTDCQSAELRWNTNNADFPNGTLPLSRLTDGVEGTRCGGAERFQRTVHFSFEQGAGPWSAVFGDFTEATEDSIDTESGWTQLPQPLEDRNGFGLAGTNAPDDLAMFLKAPLTGLRPDTEYHVELAMTFATQEPQNCAGIGGQPGESVGVKLGASGTEPEVVAENEDSFRFNIDKGGGPVNGGQDALRVGDMTNFQEECVPMEEGIWQLKTVSTQGEAFSATTDSDGMLWVYGGSDS